MMVYPENRGRDFIKMDIPVICGTYIVHDIIVLRRTGIYGTQYHWFELEPDISDTVLRMYHSKVNI